MRLLSYLSHRRSGLPRHNDLNRVAGRGDDDCCNAGSGVIPLEALSLREPKLRIRNRGNPVVSLAHGEHLGSIGASRRANLQSNLNAVRARFDINGGDRRNCPSGTTYQQHDCADR